MKKIFLLSNLILLMMTTVACADNNTYKKSQKISFFGITLGEKIITKNIKKDFFKATSYKSAMFPIYEKLYKLRDENRYCADTRLFKEGDLMCIKLDTKKVVQEIMFIKSYGATDLTNPTRDIFPDMKLKVSDFNTKYGKFNCDSLSGKEINNKIKNIYSNEIFLAVNCQLFRDDFNVQLLLDLDYSGNGGDIVSIYHNSLKSKQENKK